MASAHPPAKRQRRLVVLSSDEETEEQKQIDLPSKREEPAGVRYFIYLLHFLSLVDEK
jgi:hypothetical protein